ncbi:MAG: hypothetical protein HYX71_05640 [Opitutae bacterium]|nr:hypothetical protein [Opitutae bacterium]
MSVAELQKRITRLSPIKRKSVAKFVSYIEKVDAPARKKRLARIMRDMDAGLKYSQAQVDAILARHPPTRE